MKKIEIKKLPMSSLTSGIEYQRPFHQWRVAQIVNNFDENKIRPIQVSYRKGKFWVYDGQHLLAALKIKYGKNKNHLVYCEIHYDLTKEKEAKLVGEQEEDTKKLTEAEKVNALYVSGDNDIITMKKIIEQNNIELSFTNNRGDNKITAMKTIRKIYKKLGRIFFADYIKLLKNTWDGDKQSLNSNFLQGFFKFYNIYKDDINFNKKIFINKLSQISIKKIYRDADNYDNHSKIKGISKIILEMYNKNQKKYRLQNKL